MSQPVHPAARELLLLAVDNHWSALLKHDVDSGGNPFVTVTAKRESRHVDVTWHTRDTGTYRIFAATVDRRRNVSLTKAREALCAERSQP